MTMLLVAAAAEKVAKRLMIGIQPPSLFWYNSVSAVTASKIHATVKTNCKQAQIRLHPMVVSALPFAALSRPLNCDLVLWLPDGV